MSLNFLLLVTSLRQHEQKNRARPCVEVSFISEKLDKRTGSPFRWRAAVDKESCNSFIAETIARWPDVTVQELAAHT